LAIRNNRLASAAEFVKELRQTTRIDVPLSSLLIDARLHEIHAALQRLTPEDFHAKPKGQRLLILNRVKDLVRSEKSATQLATAELICTLVYLSRFEKPAEYGQLVETAFHWGFNKQITARWQGDQEIRNALIEAAKVPNESTHSVVADGFLKFVKNVDLQKLPGWYAHDLRRIVTALLANPECGDHAEALAGFYDRINEISHTLRVI